ncbi:MAG: phage antirepressor KilAC domain-containing protein [Terrisporobacter othiniensis]|uniref:phage antirepressor KilAC domain-containing protein n=1 Tax=Terrisporobacter othiniensis TaxID=1577792 RepID=UPI002A7579C9|nr:phage antirepressor KilAC domain-containing protein [Terrisporobacter othiniensis]MDY3372068.1 phage antirepressor KilAC domain-containing protein [Terrisporobacter othiniensis]
MNNLIVKGIQEFLGKEIPVVEGGFGEGKRCLTDKTIAEIHGMTTFNIRARISSNIKRFKEDVDYIDLKVIYEINNNLELLQSLGYSKMQVSKAEHIYLLSERGYAKLIKIMDTDLAWEIHDKLIDEYFTMREIIKSDSYMIQDPIQRALAWAEEEKVRQQQQKQLEQQKPLVDAYKQFLDVGDNMDFGTLAKHIGMGRNKIMAQLRDWKVLMTDEYTVMGIKQTGDKHNQPYQKYVDKGYFIVKHKQLKTGQYKPVTLVTPRGASAVAKELSKRGII